MLLNALTWVFYIALGVASGVFLFKRSSQLDYPGDRGDRSWMFGLLGLAVTLFLVFAELFDFPAWAVVAFWFVWFAFLAITVHQWRQINTSVQKAAVTAPPFVLAIVAVLFGIALAGPVLGLPLPGGGIKNVAVVGSLETRNTTQTEDIYAAIQAKECPTGVKYFAYDAEPGTNNMGPAVYIANIEAGVYRFSVKVLCDPLWLAATVHFIKYNVELDQAQAEAEAMQYLADPTKRAAMMQFVRDEIVQLDLVDAGEIPYYSLGMIVTGTNRDNMPKLTKFSNQPALGRSLVATLRDGSRRTFRGICDIQPSAEKRFEKVTPPVTPEKPPAVPPSTLTTPPSTTTSTTTVTTTTTPGTETTQTTPSTTSSTTTTTTGSSTTTTTPPSSTTTTSTTGSTTSTTTTTGTTTTTTPGTSTTTTTSTKGDVSYPTGKPPVGSPPGSPEPTAPVVTSPANPATTPGQAEPGPTAPGATQEPTQEPVPTVLPTGVPTETSNPGGNIPDPDGPSTTSQPVQMGSAAMALFALLLARRRVSRM